MPLRCTVTPWPAASAAESVPRSSYRREAVVLSAVIAAPPVNVKAPASVTAVGIVGSSLDSGCAQGVGSDCNGRAMMLLWQLAHTVPGGVKVWPGGTVHELVIGAGGLVVRGASVVGLEQLGQKPLLAKGCARLG
jgi:hypothetical protein